MTIRPGLGLVPFASAVDEGTALVAGDGPPRVEGLGSAYRVARAGERLDVTVEPCPARSRAQG